MELISCITPTFNRRELLCKAIDSCLRQTWQNWEMIIVDDGSEDGTDLMVKEMMESEPRIRYFRNPRKGANAARNHGILNSTGDYLVFLDDDDIHLPDRFRSQLQAVKKSGSGFILSGFRVRDLVTGKIIKTDYARSKGTGAGHGVRWMISRELLLKAGLFDEQMPSMQEVELSYRIAKCASYAFHDAIVMEGGVNHTSITGNKDRLIRGRLMLMEKQGSNMPEAEAAWWYYVIGLDYYASGMIAEAETWFRKAAEHDQRGVYKKALHLFGLIRSWSGPLKRVGMKLMTRLLNYRFPELVKREIID